MINEQTQICERCKAKNSIIIDHEYGESVCENCGLVYDDRIIADEYEKRTFENDEGDNQIQRVGPPVNPTFGNEFGTTLIIRENGKTKRIKSFPRLTAIQRNFLKIQRLLSSVNIPQKIIEEVKMIYDKINKKICMRGRNIIHIIIAIYYYVCKKEGSAKTLKEVAEKFNSLDSRLNERIIKKAFNSIKYEMAEPSDENENIDSQKNYIRTFVGGNEDKYILRELTFKIVENINNTSLLEGKNPKTIAGLSLLLSYKLLNDNLFDEKEFYSMFSNKTTLNKSYDIIKDSLNLIIPERYNKELFSYNIFP